jgi:putative peptidoglycan lipid II flippase
VLSVPVATSAFPRLAASWDAGDRDAFAALAVRSTRTVVVLAAVGSAALIAVAEPAAGLLLDRRGAPAHPAFAPAIAAFAVGLLGWSLVALLSRILFAARLVATAAKAQVAGWGAAIVADFALAAATPTRDRALVLALGNGVGVSVAATLLLVAAWRHGMMPGMRRVLDDIARACCAGAAGAAAGWSVGRLARDEGVLIAMAYGAVAAVLAAFTVVAVLAVVDRDLVRAGRAVLRGGARRAT